MSMMINPFAFGAGAGSDTITISASATTNSAAATSHTINIPAAGSGKIQIATFSSNGGYIDVTIGGSSRTLTPPAGEGWVPFADQNNGTTRHGLSIYWRLTDGTEGSTETWAVSASSVLAAIIVTLAGADISYFLDNFHTSSAISGTAPVAPSIYGSYQRTHQLRIFTGQGSSLTDTPGLLESPVSVGTTERILLGLVTPSGGGGGGQCGTYTITMGSTDDWTATTILLKPANGGGDHSSVLYRSEAGFTESGAANVAGTQATFTAQGALYFRAHMVTTVAFTATALSLKGLSTSTQVFTFQHTAAQDYLGPNGNAAGYWIRTNQMNDITLEETIILDVKLNDAAASPCRGFVRDTLQTTNQPGSAFTLNSSNTTNAGASTFDKLVFYNLSNGGTTTYSRVLLTSEPLFT